MKPWVKFCGQGASACAAGLLRLLRWTLWLALTLLLGIEVWIATAHELAVPAFLLRAFEERLAASHVQVKFGHARFDPSGRILLEDLRLYLPAFSEPIATDRVAYLELDPWSLAVGQFEPRFLHLSGASLSIPAMLSDTGRSEELVRDLDLTVRLRKNELQIEHLTARVAGIAVSGRGSLSLPARTGTGAAPLPIAELLSEHYAAFCRQVVRDAARLAALDDPRLEFELTPSESRRAFASVTIYARSLHLTTPVALQANGLTLTTQFAVGGDAPVIAPLNLVAEEVQLPDGVHLQNVHARLRAAIKPSASFEPRDVQLSVGDLAVKAFNFPGVIARVKLNALPKLDADVSVVLDGQAFTLRGTADLAAKSARARVDGLVPPGLLKPLGETLHHDIRPFFTFTQPMPLSAEVNFAPGAKFAGLSAHVAVPPADAYHVHIDGAGGQIEFDGHTFLAHHAWAKIGENYARGSFAWDFDRMLHRFLLEGRLRPLAISPWFGQWWPNTFRDYLFPAAPPDASVDVQSHLSESRLNTVFAYVEAPGPVIHGAQFDHGRTLLYVRPNYLEGQEVFATLGSGAARGTFARSVDANYDLISLDLNFDTSLPLGIPSKIFGPIVSDVLAPYWFEQPPSVQAVMHFDGVASPDGQHQIAQITAQSVGPFTFHGFPLSNLSFHAKIHDDEVVLDRIEATFAGGLTTGSARVWGTDPKRRLGFDYSVRNASLGQAVSIVDAYTAQRNGLPPPTPGKFVQDRARVKLDLAVSAEGLYDDPYSYQGSGNASLSGDSLGDVRLLGLLSELFSFTSLHFNTARASFKVAGPKLDFSQVSLTGANSAIDARGTYNLEKHELDFTAKVNPFQESSFLPTALLGVVLTPFSSVLEVKLTGQLEKPNWVFVNGPSNFFRNLSKPGKGELPSPQATPKPAPAPAAPKKT